MRWMGLVWRALGDQLCHGSAQCLGASNRGIGAEVGEGPRRELNGGVGIDIPMRDQQRTRLSVEEGARQPG